MKGVVKKDEGGKELELVEMAVPKPKANQVLVKVWASSINPSDFGFMRGTYGDQKLQPRPPVVVGFEGSGVVCEVGEGVDKSLVGKRVGYFLNCHSLDFVGSWCHFTVVPLDSLSVFSENVDLNHAAMSQVNPKTIMGFYHIIHTQNHKAVIHTAAASALGKMLLRLCNLKGIELINVVRRKENVEILRGVGAKYVLDSEDAEFKTQLAELVQKLNPTVCFEAVGGELAGTIFTAMPEFGCMYVYGSLASPDIIGVKGTDMRYKDKTISGFHVLHLFKTLTEEQRKGYIEFIRSDFESGAKIFGSSVAKCFGLDQFRDALAEYSSLASKGKILLKPQPLI